MKKTAATNLELIEKYGQDTCPVFARLWEAHSKAFNRLAKVLENNGVELDVLHDLDKAAKELGQYNVKECVLLYGNDGDLTMIPVREVRKVMEAEKRQKIEMKEGA